MHTLQTLLADLATLARNTFTTALDPAHEFIVHTRPTKLQQTALGLLAIDPATCTQQLSALVQKVASNDWTTA